MVVLIAPIDLFCQCWVYNEADSTVEIFYPHSTHVIEIEYGPPEENLTEHTIEIEYGQPDDGNDATTPPPPEPAQDNTLLYAVIIIAIVVVIAAPFYLKSRKKK